MSLSHVKEIVPAQDAKASESWQIVERHGYQYEFWTKSTIS